MGSLVWRNWVLSRSATKEPLLTEHGLYSDALFGALVDLSCSFGPYGVVGSWLGPGRPPTAARGFLRVKHHLVAEEYDPSNGSDAAFHGGRIHDELAALLSLEFGVRLQAGPCSREFRPEIDPLGRPTSFEPLGQRLPLLHSGHFGHMLPGFARSVSFDELSLTPRFVDLLAEDSIAIARAARLFQEAAWNADAQPWLAWLLFVSAVEVVASRWAGAQFDDDVTNLRSARPALVQELETGGYAGAVAIVAGHLASVSGATRRFHEFLMAFLPEAPSPRSVDGTRTSWTANDLRKAFKTIYAHRSKALHGGQPFPGILCLPPQVLDNVPNERPLAIAMATQHSTWTQQDLPFHLHIFAYIVRGSILAWWRSLLPNEQPNAA